MEAFTVVWLLVSFTSIEAQFNLGSTLQCSCELPETVIFTATNQRNESGHWNTKIIAKQQILQEDGSIHNILPLVEARQDKNANRLRITAHITGGRPRLDSEYKLIPDFGYYKFHTSGQSWQKARITCADEGSHLVIINSEKEADVIKGLFEEYPQFENAVSQDSAYAGFHDIYTEGEYLTIYGEPLEDAGFFRWAEGQPDNNGASLVSPGEDCGGVTFEGLYIDTDCEKHRAFICESELCP